MGLYRSGPKLAFPWLAAFVIAIGAGESSCGDCTCAGDWFDTAACNDRARLDNTASRDAAG